MNILFVTAEAAPFAKVGGLGDVVGAGSLPTALVGHGFDARVMMPFYGTISPSKFQIEHLFTFQFPRKNDLLSVEIYTTTIQSTVFYLLKCLPYFGAEKQVYSGWHIDMGRFVAFNQIAMAAIWELHVRQNWGANVVHANDWHTGLIPFFIKQSQQDPFWGGMRTVCTIHNMAYQGDNAGKWLYEEGIPARQHRLLHQIGAADKLLAIGIAYADYVTTVSPRHAVEIQFEPLGCGLSQLIRSRNPFVSGILNGIATNQLNPATDPYLLTNFDSTDFRQKRLNNKRHLQQLAGLPLRDEVMLIGIVSRIVWQKGFDFLIPALWEFMGMADAQLVILGTGELSYSDQFRYMQQAFPSKVRAEIRYDEGFAQKVYGGGDIFVMPSHYEPCGIGQMVAMRYGSLPLVRETGGLADTVSNYDNGDADHGTGFVFLADNPAAIVNTLRWAMYTYENNPAAWQRMQQRAMETNFSWENSAQQYITIFQSLFDR